MGAAILPDLDQLDFPALKSLILAQHEQLASRDAQIEHLKLLIAKLRRMKFGRSSEKLDRQIEQLELRLEELQTSQAEKTAAHITARPTVPDQHRNKSSGFWLCLKHQQKIPIAVRIDSTDP
jgi:transposase